MTVHVQRLSGTRALDRTKEMVELETQLFLSIRATFQLNGAVRSAAGSGSAKVKEGGEEEGRGLLPLGAAQAWVGFVQFSNHSPVLLRLRRNRMFTWSLT